MSVFPFNKLHRILNQTFLIDPSDPSNISDRNKLVPGETYALYKFSDFNSRPGSRTNPIITKYIGPIGVSGNIVRFEEPGFYQLGRFNWRAIRLQDYMTRKKRAQLTKPRYFTNGTRQSIQQELESRGPYNPKRVEKLLELYPDFLKNNFENLEVVVRGVGKGPRKTRKNRKTRKSRR
jgi:hypothetical protein